MAWAIGLAPGMELCLEALAEIVTAATVGDQAKVPCADGKFGFALLLEQSHQLGDKLREDLAHKRMLAFHGSDHNSDVGSEIDIRITRFAFTTWRPQVLDQIAGCHRAVSSGGSFPATR